MKVNLKKAAALAAAVSALNVKFDHTYATDLYGEAPDQATIDKLNEALTNQLNNGLALIEVQFTIRSLIQTWNKDVGIDRLLTERAKVEKQLTLLNSIPVRTVGPNLDRIAKQLAAAQQPDAKGYGPAKAPTFELETASLVAPLLSAAKRSKRKIDEELQSLNFRTEIELPDNVVKVLTDLDLI